jgi:hypothetical protein
MTPEQYCDMIKRQGTYFTEADVIKAIRQAIADHQGIPPEDVASINQAIQARDHWQKKCAELEEESKGLSHLANANLEWGKLVATVLVKVLQALPEHAWRLTHLEGDEKFQYELAIKRAKGVEQMP